MMAATIEPTKRERVAALAHNLRAIGDAIESNCDAAKIARELLSEAASVVVSREIDCYFAFMAYTEKM